MSGESKDDFLKFDYKSVKKFFMNRKVQIIITILVLLIIVIVSSAIRVSNLSLLKDVTTGEYTAADPDALYFMRAAGTLINQGSLSGVDPLRAPLYNVSYTQEFTPRGISLMYHVASIFSNSVDWKFIAIISPLIFFILGLIVFFLLCYYLTKSKLVALLASAFLAFSPAYLFRTMTGVLDHDSLGIFAFFSVLLVFAIGLKRYDKSLKNTLIWSGVLGLITAFSMWAWEGQMTFIFIIVPAAILVHYLFNLEEHMENKKRLIVYNLFWMISFMIFAIIEGFSFRSDILGKLISVTGMPLIFVTGFIIVDYFVQKNIGKLKFIKQDKRVFYSVLFAVLLGSLLIIISGQNIFSFIGAIYQKLLNPFGVGGRLGATVSENSQPYLSQWTSQIGKIIFWLFYIGTIFISANFAKNMKQKKEKIILVSLSVLTFLGILLSRVSSSSTFNGVNFISQLFYAGSLVALIFYIGYLYFKKRFTIQTESIVLFLSIFFMIIFGRSAARTIFVATPFVCFSAAYAINEFVKITRKTRDETLKTVFVLASIFLVILAIVALIGNPLSNSAGEYQNAKNQAKYISPAANYQWQYAMQWVRENTDKNAVFVHWWDYGYLVQTLSERKTVSDGGHAAGNQGDYNVGRYLLTTPWPESALSYMKTWNVSYLLIDPTDLGKYPAYSKIGSDNDYDRYSAPAVMILDDTQTVESSTKKTVVYQGSTFNDEDIIYKDVFIPGPVYDEMGNSNFGSYVIGVIVEANTQNNSIISFNQPVVVFYYNGNQYRIPIRYLYSKGSLIDYGSGINATFDIIPSFSQSSSQVQINPIGAGIYLSPKVSESLFAQLYLMNDPKKEYPTIKEAHFEDDDVIKYMKQNGYNPGEFVYYGGLRGPLKIWSVNYPAETTTNEEFLSTSFTFGGLDYLFN